MLTEAGEVDAANQDHLVTAFHVKGSEEQLGRVDVVASRHLNEGVEGPRWRISEAFVVRVEVPEFKKRANAIKCGGGRSALCQRTAHSLCCCTEIRHSGFSR